MKIIKQGKLPEENEIERTCKKCETVFSYMPIDVNLDTRDGNYVICPVCKAFINVSR